MIKTEIKGDLVRTWSDLKVKIHGGYPEADYDEAIDPVSMNRTYVETDIPIDEEEPTAEEIVNILTGEENDQ